MQREDVIGRANLEDTPELDAYSRELEAREQGDGRPTNWPAWTAGA